MGELSVKPECFDCPVVDADVAVAKSCERYGQLTSSMRAKRQEEIDDRTSVCSGALWDPITYEHVCMSGAPKYAVEGTRTNFAIKDAERVVSAAEMQNRTRATIVKRTLVAAKIAIHSLRA